MNFCREEKQPTTRRLRRARLVFMCPALIVLLSSLSFAQKLDQSRFTPRRIVSVNDTLLSSFVQRADSRGNLELGLFEITNLNQTPYFLHVSARR
jgi:hypothetical protein